jgi:outer membrane protein assembly factor BamE
MSVSMSHSLFRRTAALWAALACLGVVGCSSVPSTSKAIDAVSPYKIDLVQGNVVTREQLAYLKTGMNRALVRDVLGTPLLTSVFHAQRWDYVFTMQRQGAESQSRRVTVFFKDDVIEHIEADALPSEAEFVSTLKSTPKKGPLPAMEASPESLQLFPPPAVKPLAPPAILPSATTNYPPLEPLGTP